MSHDITCRFACADDLNELLALENTAFSADRLSRRQLRYHLKNPRARFWVCTDGNDRPVASLLGFFHQNRPPRLYSLATHENWRGKGLGAQLVGLFLAEARKSGAGKAILEVRADAQNAQRLYEKLGFKKTRSLPGYYEDGGDGIKMTANLRPYKDMT